MQATLIHGRRSALDIGSLRNQSGRLRMVVVWLAFLCVVVGSRVGAGSAQAALPEPSDDVSSWFEAFKREASDEELYRFLYAMPKGGDLHNHLSGSILSEWFYDLALAQGQRGYRYYTRVTINNCRPYGGNAFVENPYLMLFVNVQESNYQKLSTCEKEEYLPLDELNPQEKAAWLDSLRLDKAHEGRDEFFQTHWQRMGDLYLNPYLAADALVINMQAFGAEGLMYMESMIGVLGFIGAQGQSIPPDDVAQIYRERLQDTDALATGVDVRLQVAILRFLPGANEHLRYLYDFVSRHNDLFVAVNMVGREDNDKGYPLRFLDTLRDLRRTYNNVRLSIHAGEVDEPNDHVRDTLLLGADRIGHGINLITDPDTMRLMRNGAYLVEINLVSNLLLQYVSDYSQHPFPEYLRTGIPVALSTDDRGMWDSNLTDEFFVAVKEFNLSWDELLLLSRNSIEHGFLPKATKAELLARYTTRIEDFARQIAARPSAALSSTAQSYGFICDRYQLCEW
ncbi:adenosine deaminase [Congregibacter sp.]|uniref:adenosine deaminase family protein n=1 Tax=Congregibacter sp. TaxID=2744308 RepID=UPI00385D5774